MRKQIYLVAGARPNFVKIMPLISELQKRSIDYKLIHTGQHYDYEMSKIFFEELDLPSPDFYLKIGSGSHAYQTAKVMIKFDEILKKNPPELVIVVGDVNSTFACALVSKKRLIKVAHVESGLRSFDRTMPEEINRILTDQISDYLFITEKCAKFNLINEGINDNNIFHVGNVMIDSLIRNMDKINIRDAFKRYNLEEQNYILLTLHRPSNVDNLESLKKILRIIDYGKNKLPILFPVHPRTLKNLKKFDLEDRFNSSNIILIEPLGYIDFLNLMINSRYILTDSGGIQEEASFLKIPVLTLRKNTERPITIEKGTNTLIGDDYLKAQKYINEILQQKYKKGQDIEFWDGKSSKRIIEILCKKLNLR